MEYQVGDKVRIKSIDWYNENKDANNGVRCGNFTFYAAQYCGFTVTIALVNVNAGCYIMKEIDDVWTDEMIEGLAEEETKSENGLLDEYEELTDRAFKGGYEKCKSDIELNGFQLPEGYIFKDENGNVINAQKIVLEKKKKEYPKTYTECSDILSVYTDPDISGYKGELLWAFQKLLICRDAYWKIAGEEMGLGKPWEPDYTEESYEQGSPIKYVIYYTGTHITKERKCTPSYILTFPTAEMRDAFKENFDPDIEICKEIL